MNTAPELITRAIPSPFREETPIEKETPAENSWNSDPPGAAPITKESKPMKTINPGTRTYGVSRRHFVTTAGFAIAALCITPRRLVYLNGTAVRLKYYGPAHTDSDISVEFEDADILHVADTFWNGHYPFIDYSTGGSIDGSIRAAEADVARVTGETIVIPGHGPVGNKAQLTDFRDMLVSIREKVSALKRQGRSLAETITAKPTAEWDEKWGGWVINGRFFTTLVYLGV